MTRYIVMALFIAQLFADASHAKKIYLYKNFDNNGFNKFLVYAQKDHGTELLGDITQDEEFFVYEPSDTSQESYKINSSNLKKDRKGYFCNPDVEQGKFSYTTHGLYFKARSGQTSGWIQYGIFFGQRYAQVMPESADKNLSALLIVAAASIQ